MGHVRWNCNIVVTHGLIDILTMFYKDSLWPHILFSPSAEEAAHLIRLE